ncbi:MAG: hypothetical protein Hals2KO_13430 [Halioglobus sp.]
MSDREDKQNETPEDRQDGQQENKEAQRMEKATEAEQAQSDPEPAEVQSQPAPRKSSSAIGWLALLVAIGLGGGAAWLLPQLQQEKDALVQRVAGLEASAASGLARDRGELEDLQSGLQREINSGLATLQSSVQSENRALADAVAAVEDELAKQRKELSRFSASDRDDWLLAEVEYLLRLANQRLIMAGDTVAARALLSSADSVLREIGDTRLHNVRGAVAADLAAVRAVPTIDTEGIYLRLAALVEQADRLVIFELPEREEAMRPAPADDWRGRLEQGYQAALHKLSEYIVIRRRDVPMQALMDPQWEGLVRQNLRMLLEQAQVALLSGNQTLYRESLQRAAQWVAQFRDSDESGADAMSAEIDQLAFTQIAVEVPDVARSLLALDTAMKLRAEQGSEGGE